MSASDDARDRPAAEAAAMAHGRRDFLRLSAGAGGALGLGVWPGPGTAPNDPGASGEAARSGWTPYPMRPHEAAPAQEAPRRLQLLILGGTGFIGPHQVRYAVARGHDVMLFNRGSGREMFPELETLVGDRNNDLDALRGRTWDVVIDNARQNPDWVSTAGELLGDSVGQYIYTSSLSAYADMSVVPITTDVPTFTYETAGVEPSDELPYGLAKALSEREAQRLFPGRATIIRPGLIVGPGDETDRFTYWPARVHRGGEVLAPGDPSDPAQIIDVRDLTEWMIHCAEEGRTGVYNATGPETPWPMEGLLYGIRAVTTAETTFTWVPDDFLSSVGIRPWSHMPVWMPPRPGREGFARADVTREVEAGLTFRPLAVTARDTLDFHLSRPPERRAALAAGISPEREAEVLAAWHER